MTAETEVVKARFGADTKVSATTAMASDARGRPAPIGEVVMTLNAVHLTMLVVRKVEGQPLTTPQQRLAKRKSRASAQQCQQQHDAAENDCQHEPRMTSKDQPIGKRPRLPYRESPGART